MARRVQNRRMRTLGAAECGSSALGARPIWLALHTHISALFPMRAPTVQTVSSLFHPVDSGHLPMLRRYELCPIFVFFFFL